MKPAKILCVWVFGQDNDGEISFRVTSKVFLLDNSGRVLQKRFRLGRAMNNLRSLATVVLNHVIVRQRKCYKMRVDLGVSSGRVRLTHRGRLRMHIFDFVPAAEQIAAVSRRQWLGSLAIALQLRIGRQLKVVRRVVLHIAFCENKNPDSKSKRPEDSESSRSFEPASFARI